MMLNIRISLHLHSLNEDNLPQPYISPPMHDSMQAKAYGQWEIHHHLAHLLQCGVLLSLIGYIYGQIVMLWSMYKCLLYKTLPLCAIYLFMFFFLQVITLKLTAGLRMSQKLMILLSLNYDRLLILKAHFLIKIKYFSFPNTLKRQLFQ